jgi:hypothetical protein
MKGDKSNHYEQIIQAWILAGRRRRNDAWSGDLPDSNSTLLCYEFTEEEEDIFCLKEGHMKAAIFPGVIHIRMQAIDCTSNPAGGFVSSYPFM